MFKPPVTIVPSLWAASIVVVTLVSWLTLAPQYTPFSQLTLVKNTSTTTINQEQLIAMMQQSFNQQKMLLQNSYGYPEVELLPIAMQTELSQLVKARVALKKALENDENNVDLLNLLDFTQ